MLRQRRPPDFLSHFGTGPGCWEGMSRIWGSDVETRAGFPQFVSTSPNNGQGVPSQTSGPVLKVETMIGLLTLVQPSWPADGFFLNPQPTSFQTWLCDPCSGSHGRRNLGTLCFYTNDAGGCSCKCQAHGLHPWVCGGDQGPPDHAWCDDKRCCGRKVRPCELEIRAINTSCKQWARNSESDILVIASILVICQVLRAMSLL